MRRKHDRSRRAERKEEMMAKLDMEGKGTILRALKKEGNDPS